MRTTMERLLMFAAAVLLFVGFYAVGGWAQHELDTLPSPMGKIP